MKTYCRPIVFATVVLISGNIFAGNNGKPVLSENEQVRHPEKLNDGGLRFTPNKGQVADMNGKLRPDVLYKGEGNGAEIYLRKTGISYVYSNMAEVIHEVHEKVEDMIKAGKLTEADEHNIQDSLMQKESIQVHQVDINFEGANKNIRTINEEEAEGYNNYYYAHCPNGVLNVKQYNKVTYKNIYNNIDITYYGSTEKGLPAGAGTLSEVEVLAQAGIKYDIIVQPHADPNQIKLHWKGATELKIINENSSTGLTTRLRIKTSVNEFTESIPKVYQVINGKVIDVVAEYKLSANGIVSFSFKEGWDEAFPLIIDPWVTYYGGVNIDQGHSIATDASGNVYVAGCTSSAASIASAGFQNVHGGGIMDAFLVKFNSGGGRIWATYYGGTGWDFGRSVTTDASGNVYLAGYTNSAAAIATAGAHQTVFGGTYDAFLVKFNFATGARNWATYYGGTGDDQGNSVATDASGNVYLAGQTGSTTGIASGGFQNVYGGGTLDAFLVKFNGAGSRLWATYYGGTGTDLGSSIATDASGNIYLAGGTGSTTGIASGGFQNVHGGGGNDAFLVKFDGAGGRLWATYYGGTGDEQGNAVQRGFNSVATDASGNVYLAGLTPSATGIASGGFQNVHGGGLFDAFLVKFTGAGARLWATYIGGTSTDYARSVAVDPLTNDVYASGDTYSLNFPVTPCAWQQTLAGDISEDGFVSHFTPDGKIVCSSYVGGPAVENDEDCRIALYGCYVYMTGFTRDSYPVTPGAHQTVWGGSIDAFVAQLYKNSCGFNNTLNISFSNNTNVCPGVPVNFTPVYTGCDTAGIAYKWTFTGGNPVSSTVKFPGVTYSGAGAYPVKLVITTPCGKDSVTKTVTIITCSGITVTTTPITICKGSSGSLTATGNNGTAPYTYTWSPATGLSATTGSPVTANPAVTTTYTVTVKDNTNATVSTTVVVTVNPAVTVAVVLSNINCSGGTNGSATANPGSGTTPYTYNWSNGQTNQTAAGLSAGNYTVTVTDKKGCTVTSESTITSPPPFTGQFTKGTANCTGCGCKEWVMVNATGGTSPYIYTWPDGYINRYKNQLCPGTYAVNIKDKNGCSINVNLITP